MITLLLISVFVAAICWFLYIWIANEKAVTWIDDHDSSIRVFLKERGCILYTGVGSRDTAPSEVTYGVSFEDVPLDRRRVIAARKMKTLILKAQHGEISVAEVAGAVASRGTLAFSTTKQ